MAKKHIVLCKLRGRVYRAASNTLTYLGDYKGDGCVFTDSGRKDKWAAYQRERVRLGLPKASGR